MAEEISTQQVQPEPKTPFPPQTSSFFKYALFALAGLLLLGGATYAGYWYGTESAKLKSQIPASPAGEQPQTQIPETPTALAPTPTPAIENETANWETFTSQKGYSIKYPKRLFLEERVAGFYVLLEDSQNPMSVALYVDDRGVKTLSERREQRHSDLVNASVSVLGLDNVDGFIVEGTVGPGYGQGAYVKTAYIDLNGKELILGCEGTFCKSDFFNQILSTFKFLE